MQVIFLVTVLSTELKGKFDQIGLKKKTKTSKNLNFRIMDFQFIQALLQN